MWTNSVFSIFCQTCLLCGSIYVFAVRPAILGLIVVSINVVLCQNQSTPSPVQIIYTDQTQNVQIGAEARLHCVGRGGLHPITTWVTSTGPVPDNVEILNEGRTLVILQFEPDDNRDFICVVSDGYSTAQHNFHVHAMTSSTIETPESTIPPVLPTNVTVYYTLNITEDPITTPTSPPTPLHTTSVKVAEQMCLNCKGVFRPDICDRITRCGQHERCSITSYVTDSGLILYDLGCTDQSICHFGSSEGFGKRETDGKSQRYQDNRVTVCQQCCNGSLCNLGGLCGTKNFDYKGGRLCFNCKYQSTPSLCEHIKLCPGNSRCSIQQTRSDTSSITTWTTGCAESNCSQSHGGNCVSCCSDNLCNNDCRSPAQITQLVMNSSIHYGGTVNLQCIATGYPTPTVMWEFKTIPGYSPNNVFIESNGSLRIQNYSLNNDGDYRCTATNYVSESRTVSLQGHH